MHTFNHLVSALYEIMPLQMAASALFNGGFMDIWSIWNCSSNFYQVKSSHIMANTITTEKKLP